MRGVRTVGANITGAGITASQSSPITLDLNGSDVTLTGAPAIRIEGGANVTLQDGNGGGSLTAVGTDLAAAAIGTMATSATAPVTAGTLTIDGAAVTAQMDISTSRLNPQKGATVGGGDRVDGLTLTVQAGSLVAASDDRTEAAAIGGGHRANSGAITVNGGTVTATAGVDDEQYNVTYGAAIGGGTQGGANITVNDGIVTAITHGSGAAIGAGYRIDGAVISINGGEVTATTTSRGAAIGGGQAGNGGTITLAGGTVTALSESYGAAIGGGSDAHGGNITITGGVINAQGKSFASAIGGGSHGDGGTITIEGGDVTATSHSFGAGIGGGTYGKGGVVTIGGGTISVNSAATGAGIGGGSNGHGGAVTISGGVLDITAYTHASSVGAGNFGSTAPQRPAAELGTLHILGTALAGSSIAVTGKQASPLTAATPTNPIYFAVENEQVDDEGTTLRTAITFKHGVSFDAKKGLPQAPEQILEIGDKATEPTAPQRDGAVFTGWFDGDAPYDFDTPVHKNLNLTAGWDLNTYAVTFDSKGGNAVKAQSVDHGNKATNPKAPTRSGYTFSGWQQGGKDYNFNTQVKSNITLTASWNKVTAPKGPVAPTPKDPVKRGPKQSTTPVNLVDVSGNKNSKHYTQFHKEINWLANEGITKGWHIGGGKHEFRAKEAITREAMAAFMYRYAGSPAVKLPAKSPFSDVTPQNTNFYKEIIWMNQEGISTGWSVAGGKKEFRPKDEITRDAMAAFMYRFAGKPKTTPPASSPFVDVPKSSQFYKEVTWLSNAGISTGWTQPAGKPQYRPYDEISREAMAAFLYRLDRL